MATITQEQALRRWDILPESLKEALFSENSSITLWRACEAEHVPPEKIYTIAKIAGWVLLGFFHPEEAAREIKDRLGLSPETAMNIAKALDSRIFSRLRNELNTIYAPAGEEPSYTASKMIEEIRRAPEPTGQVVPSPTSPLRKLGETFKEEPIILHEETEFEPGKNASGFKLETPPIKFDEAGEKFTPPLRPARLEIGGEPVPTPSPALPRPPAETPKMVNYTDLRTPLMSPEQELPAPPSPTFSPPPPAGGPPLIKSEDFSESERPQPVKEVNIRAQEIKINIEKPAPPPPPVAKPLMTPMPIQKRRLGFWGWLKSLFTKKPQKEIIFAPKIISEEELKREALTIKASMPKPPPPPPRPSEPVITPRAPQTPQPTQPVQKPARGPSVFEEVVDLSTLTKTQKPFPPRDTPNTSNGNTIDLTPNTPA